MRVLVLAWGMLPVLALGTAMAQTPPPTTSAPETVYSDAQRSHDDELSWNFVQSLLLPSYNLDNEFAKWKKPVCPHVAGLQPAMAQAVERRIREVAQQIGAPLPARSSCTPNVLIFVTDDPQGALKVIAAEKPIFLAGAKRADRKMHYPIQAWYSGNYRDYNGGLHPDVQWELSESGLISPPEVPAHETLLETGLTAEMDIVVILVNSAAIMGMQAGSLEDYLALMSLSETPASATCQPAPSIANLFLSDCGADFHTAALSDADMAMMTALYQTDDRPEKSQKGRLVKNMRANLEKQSRK